MSITPEFWTSFHGNVFGTLFLLGFAVGLWGFYRLRRNLSTPGRVRDRVLSLRVGVLTMAIAAWGGVLTGTWTVYPRYRENIPTSARSVLLSKPSTEVWHNFGMEWKEHVAWLSPILATVVAFVVIYYGATLIRHGWVRKTTLTLFVLAFLFAATAAVLGSLIRQAAPVS